MKKALSLILSLILIATTMSIGITANATIGDGKAYLDTDGNMKRMSNGTWYTYITDYDNIVNQLKTSLKNKESDIILRFACKDDPSLCYSYTDNNEDMYSMNNKFASKLLADAFLSDTVSDPYDADYLYHSIIDDFNYSSISYPNINDIIDGKQYTNYTFSISGLHYYNDLATESETQAFVNEFNTRFNIASMSTPYEKVKTIYDYVVRNTEYDNDVLKGKYDMNTERYKRSHSAIGAIKGNVVSGSYRWNTEELIAGEPIITNEDQGLAVCEGIVKLFYVLCESNGIPCKIIDGDYTSTSGKSTDPHEWAQVMLDGSWYLVDPTFAIQRSIKEVHYNNYDYFLRGTSSEYFSDTAHQQPFAYHSFDITSDALGTSPLYNYSTSYKASTTDYAFPAFDTSRIDASTMILIERTYTFKGSERGAYLLTNGDNATSIEFDRDDNDVIKIYKGETGDNVGFNYNGLNTNKISKVWIPYVCNTENILSASTLASIDATTAGTHYIPIPGRSTAFKVIPYDMSSEFNAGSFTGGHSDRYSDDSLIQWQANYVGNPITPTITIVDGFNHTLKENEDYTITYQNSSHATISSMKDIGSYYVLINYKGNYSGSTSIAFSIGKIDLSKLSISNRQFDYVPKKVLEANGISSAKDEYMIGAKSGLKVGDYTLMPGKDFSVSSTGDLTYGASGTITLTGLSSSCVKTGTKKTITYTVSGKYDISALNGKWASTTPVTYTGSAITPTSFSSLDKDFEKGVDYKIVGYKNNTKPGQATVIIQGIGGCTGTAEMYFPIQTGSSSSGSGSSTGGSTSTAIDINKASVSYSNNNNFFKYTLTYGGKTLVKGADFTESIKVSGSTGVITLTGIGKFGGITKLNLPSTVTTPSASGNYIKVSNVTYNGKAQKPTFSVYNSSNKLVNKVYIKSTTYSNNKNVGLGKITVKLANGQTVVKTFSINPQKTALGTVSGAKAGFKAIWTKKTSQTTGYEIQYSTSSTFKKPKTAKITKNTTTSKTISKLGSKKTYYVRIRTYKTVSGKTYYSAWSAKKSVKTK